MSRASIESLKAYLEELKRVYIQPLEQALKSLEEKVGEGLDLADYVQFTDYASQDKPGVIKATSNVALPIYIKPDATLDLGNNNTRIANKNNTNAIRNKDIDFTVKIGLTTNTETLTDEEKTSACDWLGALKALPIATGSEKTKVPSNKYNNSTGDYTVVVDGYNQAGKFTIPTRGSKGEIHIPDSACEASGAVPTGEVAINRNFVEKLVADLQAQIDEIKGV